jgi:stage IV sporulation protein FB
MERTKGMWNVWRVGGIDVRLHWTFLALVAFAVISASARHGLLAGVQELFTVAIVFGCVLLHEFGHAGAARRLGIGTHSITLLPIGGVASLDKIPRRSSHEIAIALAGPAVNVGLLAMGLLLDVVARGVGAFVGWQGSDLVSTLFRTFLWVNGALLVFNLLPVFPMDGGRVLRAALARWMRYDVATWLAVRAGQVMGLLLFVVGFLWQPLVCISALFVMLAGQQELRQVQADQLRSWREAWATGLGPSRYAAETGRGLEGFVSPTTRIQFHSPRVMIIVHPER